jgi:gas vesicle protein
MITPGEVRAIRELKTGVQAQVCLGADPKHGSAVAMVTTNSPDVKKALDQLKDAIRKEAHTLMGDILEGQKRWDEEMSA